jgi:hypothetical protein
MLNFILAERRASHAWEDHGGGRWTVIAGQSAKHNVKLHPFDEIPYTGLVCIRGFFVQQWRMGMIRKAGGGVYAGL